MWELETAKVNVSVTRVVINVMSMWRLRWRFTRQSPLQGHLTILKFVCQSVTQLNTRAKSMMTGTVPSSGRSGTAAVMTQSEQTAEEHSTLEQQPPATLHHPAWCVVWCHGAIL